MCFEALKLPRAGVLPALLFCLFATLGLARTSAQDALLLEDRARLLAGVADFNLGGSPGIAVATGPRVVDLLHDKAGRSLILAGRHGSGKFLIMTQGIEANEAPGARSLLENLLAWLRKESDTRPILCVQASSVAANLKKQGRAVAEASRLPADLSAYSIVYLGYPWKEAQDYTDAEIKRLQDWTAGGGSLWCHAMGWVYLKYHETGIARQDLRLWSANRIFGPLGAWISGGVAGAAQPVAERPASLLAELAQALDLLESEKFPSPEWADELILSLLNLQYSGLSISSLIEPKDRERIAKAYAKLGARV